MKKKVSFEFPIPNYFILIYTSNFNCIPIFAEKFKLTKELNFLAKKFKTFDFFDFSAKIEGKISIFNEKNETFFVHFQTL